MNRYRRGAIRRRIRRVAHNLMRIAIVAEVLGLQPQDVRDVCSYCCRPSDELVRRVGIALDVAISDGRLVECRYRGRQRWERGEL